ncbi:4-hydroxy-3-polyprenylbenzoate decarboxylase [Paenibacillus sp. UNCCL117]|uniref:UbiX family flavin prenyltransferase n=1 Tax=unclassified Paenibacillus TaxID=185978 RepID=UPI00088FCC29|nr:MULTISPECIES: flavin prenyltransferase UbiX [unclassified Paenibacillus]SDC40379.1 4-hydroxy-3-polyprenylbenzoate decarboxylase [Paenibacillus sp. cl123]SFW13819.1 4-hydroxy-3-polyprenylbenzoate decarboxylase [Paenibacillus sp. UNCCL117]
MKRPWVIGITGASGAAYGVRLCRFLLSQDEHVHLIITEAGWRVLKEELGWDAAKRQAAIARQFEGLSGKLDYVPVQDIGAKTASGSFLTKGMVILPCSMGTLASLAGGASDNLLERTADVMLKEGRKLILVPRETPLHAIHLENMLKLARMGVRMIPAMPAFYQGPQTVDDMVDFIVGKVLDAMEIEHHLYKRWGMPHDTEQQADPDRTH